MHVIGSSLQPNATIQSTLFDMMSENFVALLNNMDDDKYKDVVFMVS